MPQHDQFTIADSDISLAIAARALAEVQRLLEPRIALFHWHAWTLLQDDCEDHNVLPPAFEWRKAFPFLDINSIPKHDGKTRGQLRGAKEFYTQDRFYSYRDNVTGEYRPVSNAHLRSCAILVRPPND